MLQLSLVCERWPLGGIGRLRSGIGAPFALSWAVGTGAYFLFVNLDAMPAAETRRGRAAQPRRPPSPDPIFGSALITVGVWQAVLFIALRGWPRQYDQSAPASPARGQRASSSAWVH